MPNAVRAIPVGYHSITPGLTCKDAGRAMDFYKQIFGATEIMRMAGPDGKVMHGELRIGDSVIFVADEFPGMSCAPTPGATNPVSIFMYTEHVDATFNRAVAAGAKVRSEEHTSELQSPCNLVCRLLLEKKKTNDQIGSYSNKSPIRH